MNPEMGEKPFKTTADIALLQTEKVMANIGKGALALPIIIQEEHGFLFHGNGKLILDAIIETDRGAMGESIEKSLTKPFIMLGDEKKLENFLTAVDAQDVTKAGYRNYEDFRERAEELCRKFIYKRNCSGHETLEDGVVLAFQNEDDKLDWLLSSDNKLAYVSKEMTFLHNSNKIILKRPGETILSQKGKLCILKNTQRNASANRPSLLHPSSTHLQSPKK